MSSHKEIEKQAVYWYVKLKSPDFSSDQEAAFFEWLESSVNHQAAFLRIEQAWTAGKVGKHLPAPAKKAIRPSFYWAGALATVLLGIVLYTVKPLDEDLAQAHHFATASDQFQTITLADGSLMTLGGNTEVNVALNSQLRLVKLERGHVFLKVAHNPAAPFVVNTTTGSLRVIGTQFSVDNLPGDFRITVVEGRVGLLPNAHVERAVDPFIVLTANQQILYSEALSGKEPKQVDANEETRWTSGRLTFDGSPLIDVVARINQHLSHPIHLASPALEQKRIVGTITIKNAKAAAESLALITGAKVIEDTSNQSGYFLTLESN